MACPQVCLTSQTTGESGLCSCGYNTGRCPSHKLLTSRYERGFAVQVLSRFFIPRYLCSVSALSPTAKILCLANAGVSLDDLDVDDMCLFKREGQYGRTRLFFQQSFRDSSVLDSFVLVRYPRPVRDLAVRGRR